MSLKEGWWSPPNSAIRFCEPSYVHFDSIAEFWNSITALAYTLSAILFVRKVQEFREKHPEVFPESVLRRFQTCGWAYAVVGVGSFIFHATQNWWAELLDEVPMVVAALTMIYCQMDLHPLTTGHTRKWFYPGLFVVAGLGIGAYVFMRWHPFFTLLFTLLILLSGFLGLSSPVGSYVRGKPVRMSSGVLVEGIKVGYSRSLMAIALVFLILGRSIWELDQVCVRLGWLEKNSLFCSLSTLLDIEGKPVSQAPFFDFFGAIESQRLNRFYELVWYYWAHSLWHLFSASAVYFWMYALIKLRVELYHSGPVRHSPKVLAKRNLSSNYMIQMLGAHVGGAEEEEEEEREGNQ